MCLCRILFDLFPCTWLPSFYNKICKSTRIYHLLLELRQFMDEILLSLCVYIYIHIYICIYAHVQLVCDLNTIKHKTFNMTCVKYRWIFNIIYVNCISSGPFFAAWIIFAKFVEQTRAGFGGDPQQPKVSETWTCPCAETHLSVPFLGFYECWPSRRSFGVRNNE